MAILNCFSITSSSIIPPSTLEKIIYIEKWFPEKNVRYVSVNDGIDTFSTNNGNSDIAPFKSILNDMYSKDLSKKIKTALHTMQTQGKCLNLCHLSFA